MDREIRAARLEFLAERARIGFAALDPVGDQNDGGSVLRVVENPRRLAHRRRQRRPAQERKPVGGGDDRVRRAGRRRHDKLDVLAAILLAMPIGHQADRAVARQGLEHAPQRIAGNLLLRPAAHRRPHGAGSVENDHGSVGGEARRGRQGRAAPILEDEPILPSRYPGDSRLQARFKSRLRLKPEARFCRNPRMAKRAQRLRRSCQASALRLNRWSCAPRSADGRIAGGSSGRSRNAR